MYKENNNLNILRKTVVFGMILLITVSVSMITEIGTKATKNDAVWDGTLDFSETGDKIDYVVFGEAPDANDGEPVDSYDVMKPLAPMPPYIQAWFDDGLPMPYDKLWEDFRQYPDTEKVWDLYVRWKSSNPNPTIVSVSWDPDEFDGNEYDSIVLNRYNFSINEWVFAANMLTEDTYTYTPQWFNEQWLTDHFQIVAITDGTESGNTLIIITVVAAIGLIVFV